jgi:hypothetical protein
MLFSFPRAWNDALNERTIFLGALDREDPAERAAYLDAACAGDPALRQQI